MLTARIFIFALLLSLLTGSFGLLWALDTSSASLCLNRSSDESRCKDCCDSLDADGATRRSCRDTCSVHDFSLNTDIIPMRAVSQLGPDGDYSVALSAGDGAACKEYCDGSESLANGDRHYCRDACNALYGKVSSPDKDQARAPKGLPPEIVAACQSKQVKDSCQVGDNFNATCRIQEEQLACLLSQDEAVTEQQQQWAELDRNQDGFLDANEANGDEGRKEPASDRAKKESNKRTDIPRPPGPVKPGEQGSLYSAEQAISSAARSTRS